MSGQLELPLQRQGEALEERRSDEAKPATNGNHRSGTDHLLEEVVERRNLFAALRRVKRNKGSPGMDRMSVDELPKYLHEHWPRVRAELLAGTYRPRPVRRQEIPKPEGGTRQLGIPTVLDRLIQQAILQVLQPRLDPTFSEHSYGFRPGRGAHGGILAAQRYIQDGRRVVVDVDLERFFDRVNHDVLMGKLAKRIADKRLLGLIRRFLEAGMMVQGVVIERFEGTPQGGPLSPLLANLLLDEVDKELERRGHAFVRYADDLNVYVRSPRAGERVSNLLQRLFGRLRLRVNEEKSAIANPRDRKFLGYSFWYAPGAVVRRKIAPKAIAAFKERVREMTSRVGGRSMSTVVQSLRSYLNGWKAYFRLAETPNVFRRLDRWIRHRLRAVQLRHWAQGGAHVVFRELVARGIERPLAARTARFRRHWWKFAASKALSIALPSRHFDDLGLPRLEA